MIDYIEIESTPTGEDCTQVSSEKEYWSDMLKECNRYIEMLRLRFPNCNKIRFARKTNQHDFGSYAEVAIYFNDEDDTSIAQMNFIEDNLPEKWNDGKVLLFDSNLPV